MKIVCNTCRVEKPEGDYHRRTQSPTGRQHKCKQCYRDLRKTISRSHEREIQRKCDLKRKYGITVEEYDALVLAQGGKCGICLGPPTRYGRLYVDHCHTTGEVRGLLCCDCNLALGKLNDDPVLLERAIGWVRRIA